MGTKSRARYAAAAAGQVSTRSTQLAEILRAKWKNEIKLLPPSRRWSWLKSSEAIIALGAKTAGNLVKQLERRGGEALDAFCSPNWVDAWLYENVLPASLRFESDDEVIQVDDGRQYSVRLQRSRGLVRAGDVGGEAGHLPTAGIGTSRWTPPTAPAWEDENDLMTVREAYYFTFPSSCSAEARPWPPPARRPKSRPRPRPRIRLRLPIRRRVTPPTAFRPRPTPRPPMPRRRAPPPRAARWPASRRPRPTPSRPGRSRTAWTRPRPVRTSR